METKLEYWRRVLGDIDHASRQEVADVLKRIASSLPWAMDSLYYNVGMYLSGQVELDEFMRSYCKNIEPLYRRIAVGTEKELFSESYEQEINMIAGIRNAMSDETDAAKLDKTIDSLAREYIKNRHLIHRKKYFAV